MNQSLTPRNTRQAPPQRSADASEDADLLNLVQTLWRGKLWIIGFAFVAALLGGYYAFEIATPKYRSSTTLSLEVRAQQIVDLDSVISGVSTEQAALNTELEVIKSRNLIGRLVDDLNLVSDPEFNASLRPDPAFSLAKLKTSVKSALNLMQQPEAPGPEQPRNGTISQVRAAVSTSVARNTYVFRIAVETQSPAKSARIANALADLYVADQIGVKFEATERAVAWLSERAAALEQELEAREDALKIARAETELISSEALEALNRQAKDVRERLDDTRQRATREQALFNTLQTLSQGDDLPAMARAAADPALDRLLTDVQAADAPAEPRRLFVARFQSILTRAQVNAERVRAQSNALAVSLEKLQREIDDQAADLVKIRQMEREIEATRTLYETFLTRLKETTVQRGLQQADSRILSPAIPGEYVSPRKTRILALAMVLGGILGAAVMLMRQYLHNVFRSAQELEQATGRPVLGQIPKIPVRRRGALIRYLNDRPTSAAAEAVRNLRTSVLLSDIDNPPKVILSTSSVPGEGKTTQAIALAHNFAGLGKKVLLIEGDIRRRTFAEYFDTQPSGGIVTALTGETALHEVVFHDARLKADVLMGEKTAVNAADLFSSEAFQAFLGRAREAYDFVIIDTPPVLVVPDARVLAQHADAIIYTVAWDKTHQSQVIDGLKEFDMVNKPVTGLVLAQISPRGMKRYGYGGKHGAYARYGSAYYDAG